MATQLPHAKHDEPVNDQFPEPIRPPESIPVQDANGELSRRIANLASFYTATAQLSAELDWNLLLQETLAAALHLANADGGSLMLLDDSEQNLYIAEGHNLPNEVVTKTHLKIGEGVAGWVARRRVPLLLIGQIDSLRYPKFHPKPRIVGSSICTPMQTPERADRPSHLIGVLNLSRRVGSVNFEQEDLELATAFCTHAATVIENARFCRNMSRRAEQSQHLIEISRNLIASLEIEVVLREIMDKAVELLHCQSGSLVLVDDQTGELIFKVVVGPGSRQLLNKRLPAGTGIVGTTVKEGRSLIVNDAKADPRHYGGIDNSTALTTQSLLCVPLINKNRVIGALELVNKIDGTSFDEEDRNSLSALAVQSAIALENAQLYTDLKRSFADTVAMIANAVEARDRYTAGHTARVTRIAMEMARELKWSREKLDILEIGALLHDIGKIGIPDLILQKPSDLTEDEYAEMKQHPVVGAQMLKGVSVLRPMLPYILFHQERYDGKGYPFGLAGKEIPLEGRLLAVADTLDAMTSSRPYRRGLTAEEAIAEIVRNRGTQFDPEIVDALLGVYKKGKLGTPPDEAAGEAC